LLFWAFWLLFLKIARCPVFWSLLLRLWRLWPPDSRSRLDECASLNRQFARDDVVSVSWVKRLIRCLNRKRFTLNGAPLWRTYLMRRVKGLARLSGWLQVFQIHWKHIEGSRLCIARLDRASEIVWAEKNGLYQTVKMRNSRFWASWCSPCRALAPTIQELADEYAGKIFVGKLNVDENPSTAERFQVFSIPTVLIMKDGEEADRIVGCVPKDYIVNTLKKYLG